MVSKKKQKPTKEIQNLTNKKNILKKTNKNKNI